MSEILEILEREKIVPVAVIEEEETAVPLAEALLDGGIGCIEVTFRTKAAKAALRAIKENCPDMTVGAGTILTAEQAGEAEAAGAEFIVSPGLVPEVVTYCVERGLPVIPGCVTPTEILQAMSYGLKIIKFFPAEQYGGLKTLKSLGEVFADIRFMPTGGIGLHNLREYLDYEKVCACGGSFMVKKDLIAKREFAKITELAKECRAYV